MALEPKMRNTAYQLGRLFALLEAAENALPGRANSLFRARYFAIASTTPARVFGPLLRRLKHNVTRTKKRGRGNWIEAKIGEIMLILPANLPKTLRLEDQGRFAVGYYHERATRLAKSNDTKTDGKDNGEQKHRAVEAA